MVIHNYYIYINTYYFFTFKALFFYWNHRVTIDRLTSVITHYIRNFVKLISNELFKFFEDRNLLSNHQSGFRPSNSCIYQLLKITHNIFLSFDYNPPLEICSVFPDISKTYERVWRNGLLFKLKQNGFSGNLFQLIKSFLSGRFQRVILNGQTSDWETIQAGIIQGSV